MTLTTLGGASLACANEIVLLPGKPLALVTYLALTPGHIASREFLLDLLWADLDRDRGRHALRQTLWQLRQLLGDSCLTGREELALGLPIESDRDRFLAAIETQDLDAAVQLYHGDFLPDFALPGSNEFEHWAEIERSRLRSTFLRAAEMLVRRRLATGPFRDAQHLARRMRDADPSNETGWRLLLESHLASRDLIQAAVEADALAQSLLADGREPEPATKELLARLKTAQGETASPGVSSGPGLVAELVGREREFALLLDAWNTARRGPARHLHLTAPAGHGKTRLLTDLAHRLRSLGARAVYLRANPGDRAVPYALAGDLAHALGPLPGLLAVSPAAASALVGLSPSLSARFSTAAPLRNAPELLRLRTAALTEAIAEVAAEHPATVLIDDSHWLDAESHQIVEGILHRLDRAPVLMVTAGRPGIGRPLEAAATTLLELEPLDPAAIQALIASLGRMTDGALLQQLSDRLHRSTAGSPLLVLESLQLALDRGRLRLADGIWSISDPPALLAEADQGNALAPRLSALDADAAWLLLLLATAGTPLTTGELRQGTRAREKLDEHLWSLERKGLIRRAGESWDAAHDEIAAAHIVNEPLDRRRSAHAAVGRILLDGAAGRVEVAIQACRHLALADDGAALGSAFRRAVAVARVARDPRDHHALALACVGESGPPGTAARLVGTLPIRTRLGLDSRFRLGAVAAAILFMAATAVLAWRQNAPPPPDAQLLLIRSSPSDSTASETTVIPLRRSDWRVGEPIRAAGGWGTIQDPRLASAHAVSVSPNGTRWVFHGFADNKRTDDLFLRERGASQVLVSADRDDVTPVWSPFGDLVFFSSAQWSKPGADDYDIGVVDPSTGVTRQLTGTDDFDQAPSAAPHGVLVAFTRAYRTLRARQACWMTRDARVVHCAEATGGEVTTIAGWLDERRVLVEVAVGEQTQLMAWDLLTDEFAPFFSGGASRATVSPDGQWIACICSPNPTGRRGWMVFPSSDPAAYRPLERPDSIQVVAWEPNRGEQPGRPSVRIERAAMELPVGQTYLAEATVSDGRGRPISLPKGALRWTSRDTAVARVDSISGQITARQLGRAVIAVALADLAADSTRVTVEWGSTTPAFREQWRTIDSTRWIDFGVPAPRLALGPGGVRGLSNNGDGSYPSGVISAQLFDPATGIGVSARLSVPVTRSQWQNQLVTILSRREWPIEGWDRRTGNPHQGRNPAVEACSLHYPASEGIAGVGLVHLEGGHQRRQIKADSTWRLGDWHTVEIQLFPDGTCGFRLDGVPIWRSDSKLPLDQRYRILLAGNSAGTNVVVGPVEVWTGVRRDLAWPTLADSSGIRR